jgi:SAM-dependent methyltransferase
MNRVRGGEMLDYEYANQCPLCGSEGKFYKSSDRAGVHVSTDKCLECGVIYQNPRLTREALQWYYSSGTYQNTYPPAVNTERSRANRLLVLISGLDLYPRRCLDIGCGRGLFLKSLQDEFKASVTGVDYYRNGDAVVDKIVSDKNEVEGKFDLITCIQTCAGW